MIKIIFSSILFIFILSCNSIELLLNESDSPNLIKNKVIIIASGEGNERYVRDLYSFFGDTKNGEYILVTTFTEKKENLVVKKNQVAEKINYELSISYELFYKNRECKILDKKNMTKFTISPKSSGYNFGTDRSFEKLYSSSIKKNIQNFIRSIPSEVDCLK